MSLQISKEQILKAGRCLDMPTYTLIRECSRKGITLTADGDSLKIDAPKGCVTAELKESLALAKPELMETLTHLQEIGFSWDAARGVWTML